MRCEQLKLLKYSILYMYHSIITVTVTLVDKVKDGCMKKWMHNSVTSQNATHKNLSLISTVKC